MSANITNRPRRLFQGLNTDCTRTAILPLTDQPTTVTSVINSMQAQGGTNIH
ncbi:MAG: hypothetical protein MO852_02195 [Candidatus Devosia euplotis]|nr:hypothetical protein [Candidatus Devosia euplotis]